MAKVVTTYTKSETGYYKVLLTAVFEHAGFFYKPAFSGIVVNEDVLKDMIAAGVVSNVSPA